MQRFIERQFQASDRRGAILVLAAVVMVILLAFVAMTVDVGFVELTRTQLQLAADAGALAGAMELSATDDPALVRTNARNAILQTAALHRAGDKASVVIDPVADITFGKTVWNAATQSYTTQWGNAATPYSVVKVRAMRTISGSGDNRLPLFFAPAVGSSKADVGAEAIATFQPRDIMVVLDFSASMRFDSCLGRINLLGRSQIESNLQTMWTELGSPVYGNLIFTPKYATLKGRAASGTIPHIDVTFKRTSVDVVSTANLIQVKLQFSGGSTQTFTVSGTTTGTYSGTGGNSGSAITSAWVKSGTNASLSSGNNGEQFDFTSNNIKTALGLTGTYPYPGGSWDEFISVVQSGSGQIFDAGYRDMYGYLTWINYLQTNRCSFAETPDLWKTSEQPVGLMKDSVDVFIDFLNANATGDQVGLSIYTHPSSAGAILEYGLSGNLTQIKTTTRKRQAGHYTSGTDIAAGMKLARNELTAQARPRASRLMVVLTDGQANLPDTTTAVANVLAEANAAKANKIKILTISLGILADTNLMQQTADITGGIHFDLSQGGSISSVKAKLQNVFREIAGSRPLKLVSGQ